MRFVTLFFVMLLFQVPERPSGIGGTVTDQGTGNRLSRATVILQREDGTGRAYDAMTSLDGRFAIEDVTPGRYWVSVTRDGYAPAQFGIGGARGCGTPITLEAGRRLTDVLVSMLPAGVIAGRLYDSIGEAASNVAVQALRYVYRDGSRILTSVQSAQTNDLGEYRLFWLTPGRYFVVAGLENAGNRVVLIPEALTRMNASPARSAGMSILPVYYPGSADPKTASVIELRAGETFQAGNIPVTRAQMRSVRGTVRNAGSNETLQEITVSLYSRVGHPGGGRALRGNGVRPDGSFEIQSVLPGAYDLLATGKDSTGLLSGQAIVDVAGADIPNIEVFVTKGVELEGRVRMDDPVALARITNVTLRNLSENAAMRNTRPLSAQVTNGTFKLVGIPAGDYQAYVSFSLPNDIYVKSMLLGSTDVRNRLRIDGQPFSQLEIALGNNGGALEGVLVAANGQPVGRGTVVLAPEESLRQRSTLFKTASTDASGAFRISSIGPGNYKVFAWEAVETGAWEDADFLRPYEALGQAVSVREGDRQALQLLAIPSSNAIYGQCQSSPGLR